MLTKGTEHSIEFSPELFLLNFIATWNDFMVYYSCSLTDFSQTVEMKENTIQKVIYGQGQRLLYLYIIIPLWLTALQKSEDIGDTDLLWHMVLICTEQTMWIC